MFVCKISKFKYLQKMESFVCTFNYFHYYPYISHLRCMLLMEFPAFITCGVREFSEYLRMRKRSVENNWNILKNFLFSFLLRSTEWILLFFALYWRKKIVCEECNKKRCTNFCISFVFYSTGLNLSKGTNSVTTGGLFYIHLRIVKVLLKNYACNLIYAEKN